MLKRTFLVVSLRTLGVSLLALLSACAHMAQPADPLASWNDGPAKSAIVAFVKATTDPGSPAYVPPAERVATFDQDGTMWVEHPLYTEIQFVFARIVELAPQHPEWRTKPPFAAVLANDRAALANISEEDLFAMLAATHTGVTVDAFNTAVKAWVAKAKHPRWNRAYTDLTYAPMQEVMRYLRANGYLTYIVSGGSVYFMRAFTDAVYGLPPQQVIGTAFTTRYTMNASGDQMMIEPKLLWNNDKAGKAQDIELIIGRRPQAAFGNTAGDQEMLAWSQGGPGKTLQMLVLHDDAQREYAYGPAQGLPATSIGTFSQALYDDAVKRGWTVISMKRDWKRVFSFEP